MTECNIVLIDTWWNVNHLSTLLSLLNNIGFNRYMVECKYVAYFIYDSRCSRFNRYMVECKYVLDRRYDTRGSVLIDTWWNVNKYDITIHAGHNSFNRYMVECKSSCNCSSR